MLRLRGKPLSGGTALGSAMVLRAPYGIPLLPARLVALLAKANENQPVEPIDVVIVAKDYTSAVSMSFPWANVVGIVVEQNENAGLRLTAPTVVGVERLMEVVQDDDLVLVDADRGVVIVDPDGLAIANYQAEKERIAPRRRFYIDAAHLSARTLDGKDIRVLAKASTLDDIRSAMEQGADAIYVPQNSDLLPADEEDGRQYERLLVLGQAATGKPVTLAGDPMTISLHSLMRACVKTEFTLSAPLSVGNEGFAEITDGINECREDLLNAEKLFQEFQLAGYVPLMEELDGGLADYFLGRVVIDSCGNELFHSQDGHTWMDAVILAANSLLVPVEVVLPDDSETALQVALGLGAAGVIVEPEFVATTKERIRQLDIETCRLAIF